MMGAPEYLAEGFNAAAVAEPIAALLAFTVVAILVVVVKWGLPQRSKLKEKQLEIERYRIEVDERAANALDDRERERIRNTAAMVEQQRQNNENTKALISVVTAYNSRIEESASRSHEMGGEVSQIKRTSDHMRETTDRTAKQVDGIYRHIFREERD